MSYCHHVSIVELVEVHPCGKNQLLIRVCTLLHSYGLRIAAHMNDPWDIGVSTPLPENVRLDIVLLILWHLWKSRNAAIFDQTDSSSQDIINRVARNIDSWMGRYKRNLPYVREWRTWLDQFVSMSWNLLSCNLCPLISSHVTLFLGCQEPFCNYERFKLMVGGDLPPILL